MTVVLPVAFVDTAAASLRWVSGCEPRPALATKNVEANFANGGVVVQLRVLGASHQVIVKRNDELLFSETIACATGGSPLAEAQQTTDAYAFESNTEVFGDHDFAARVEAIEHATHGINMLAAAFPGSPLAVTAMQATHSDDAVMWQTWHAYPQTGEIVTTNSRLRVR